jgi:hypothetical protein
MGKYNKHVTLTPKAGEIYDKWKEYNAAGKLSIAIELQDKIDKNEMIAISMDKYISL